MTHRKVLVLCLLLLGALLAAPSAWADPICTTLTTGSASVGDVFISSGNPTTNFDDQGQTGAGHHGTSYETLMHIDVSFVPTGSTITSATVTLQETAASGYPALVDVNQILGGWNPATVTWDDFTAGFNPTPVASFYTAASGTDAFDLTSLTQGWVNGTVANYGILLQQSTGETIFDFSPADNVQIFTVCYSPTAAPSLALQKTVSTNGICPGTTTVTVAPGTQVTSCYQVTNTGNVTISGVVVDDAGTAINIGDIAPGASGSGSATAAVTSSSDTAAVATGTYGGSQVSSAPSDAPIDVLTSSLSLTKTISLTGSCPGESSVSVLAGTQAAFCYAVTNTGGLAISGISVTDAGSSIAIGSLAPGASGSGSITFTANANSDTPAVATGTDSTGASVSSPQSEALVNVVSSSLGVNPTCQTSGVVETIDNPGAPAEEVGTCASGDGYTLLDALAFCGADVSYFAYTCTDYPANADQSNNQEAWTANFACCVPAGTPTACDLTQTDVGCGGQCAQACSVGQSCNYGTDCISDYCVSNVCATPSVLDSTCTNDGTNATLHNSSWPSAEVGSCADGYDPFTIFDAAELCPGGVVKYYDYTCTDFPAEPPYSTVAMRTWESDYSCCVQTPTSCTIGGQVYTPGQANPANACQSCQPSVSSSAFTDVADGTACDDGNACTGDDVCTGGVCAGTPYGCAAPGQCQAPGTCNGDGTCSFANVADGTACNDGDACTDNDVCTGGACAGTPYTCAAPGQCQQPGTCNGDGTCSFADVADGTACDDGDACTAGDVCTSGACGGTPYTCAAMDCQASSTCDGDGGCTVVDQPSGTACTDDGNPCTSDLCDGSGDCTHPAVATGTSCGGGQVCIGTACTAIHPSLSIVKTVSTNGQCPGSPSVTVYAGTTVTYCYAVTNTGDTPVNAVVVTDGNISVSVGALAAGQTGSGQANLVISSNTDTPAVAAGVVTYTGAPVSSPPSSAAVDVVFPALSIAVSVSENGTCPGEKVVDVEVGTPITWCYVVTNSGDTTVNDIQVTDNELGVVPGAPFSLSPGQSQTLSRADVAATSITLVASAAGIDAVLGGEVVSPQDSAAVNIVSPDVNISVTISTNGTCPGDSTVTVPAGETVTNCYAVTNNGDDTLYNVIVTSPSGAVIGTIPTLGAGATTTLSTPNVPVVGNATVTATATGSDAYGDSVTSTGTALLYALQPSLSLQKTVSTNGQCPGVAAVTVLNPTQVTYCYLVTNTGQTTVDDITVGDNGTSTPVGNLVPGQSQMVSSTVTATTSSDTSATASGVNAPTDAPVSSNPSAAAVTVVNPALAIVKTVSLDGACPGLPSVSVLAGTAVTYCYAVTNTGDTTISGVVVSDNGVTTTIGTLAPGQTGSGSAPYTATTTDADTSAVASGTVVATGTPVSSPPSAALVHIVAPSLSIVVTVSTNGTCPGEALVTVESGTGVLWCYAVTNTGNVPVAGITVTDNVYGLVPGAALSLSPGQTATLSRAAAPTVSTTVTGSATGVDTVVGSTVTSNLSTAAVNVVSPKVNIVVTVSTNGACPGTPSVSVPVGTNVTYCYDVSNAGNDTLVNVEVENQSGTVLFTIPSLAPGASDQLTGATAPATTNATVYGTALATDSYGDSVSANGTATVTVLFPKLVLTKTAPATINAGACPSLDYTIKVANNGAAAAAAPVVTDVLPANVTYVSATTTSGSCSFAVASNTVTCTLANLAAGASATITIDTTTLQGSGTITNTASVTTTTPQAVGAIDTASASTEIVPATCSSSGTVSASFNGTSIKKGQTIWFTGSAQVGGIPNDEPSTLWSLGGTINFSCGGKSYSVPVPPSQVTFDPTCNGATTSFDDVHNQWNTHSPCSFEGNVFVAGVQWQAPEDLPGGINPITWSSNIVSNNPKLNVSWQWAASVLDQAPCDNNALGVKPLDDGSHCSGGSGWGQGWQSDPCGTPESNKGTVCGGARGSGQGDWCGQRTNPSCGQTPPVQSCPSPGIGPLPKLVLTKSAPATINAGACPSLPYTITVTNAGTATAASPVVTDALPSGVVYVSASTTSGSCSFASASRTVTCTLGNLAAGASATVTIDTTTLLPSGTITNTASVTTSTSQTSDTGNTASATTQIEAATCQSSGTISTGFNNSWIEAGETVWFTAVAEVSGIPTNATSSLWSLGGNISFTANGTHYTVPVPPGKVTFEPSCSAASTSFDHVNNQWNTTAPCSFSGNVFVAAVAWQAPVNLPGGINPVTWSSNIVSNNSNLAVSWQWSAATYNQGPSDYNSLNVKPLDEGSKCGGGLNNSDPCGTPEAFKPWLCAGATSTGHGDYCGQRSGSSSCGHPPVQACQ